MLYNIYRVTFTSKLHSRIMISQGWNILAYDDSSEKKKLLKYAVPQMQSSYSMIHEQNTIRISTSTAFAYLIVIST